MSHRARKTRRNRTNQARNIALSHRLPPTVWFRREMPSVAGAAPNYKWSWRTDIGRDIKTEDDALLIDEGSVIGILSGDAEVHSSARRQRYASRPAPNNKRRRSAIRKRHGSEAFTVVWTPSKSAKAGGYWRKKAKNAA